MEDDITDEIVTRRVDSRYKRVVVEICCGEASRISEKRNYVDHDCPCIIVTIADDFTKEDETVFRLKMGSISSSYNVKAMSWKNYVDMNDADSGFICEKEGTDS